MRCEIRTSGPIEHPKRLAPKTIDRCLGMSSTALVNNWAVGKGCVGKSQYCPRCGFIFSPTGSHGLNNFQPGLVDLIHLKKVSRSQYCSTTQKLLHSLNPSKLN